MKKESRKLEKKMISSKNILEDMKTIYEEIFKKEYNREDNSTQKIELNEKEYIQITKWADKKMYDFIHYKNEKRLIEGAISFKNNEYTVEAIYKLDFNFLTNEADFMKSVYH